MGAVDNGQHERALRSLRKLQVSTRMERLLCGWETSHLTFEVSALSFVAFALSVSYFTFHDTYIYSTVV